MNTADRDEGLSSDDLERLAHDIRACIRTIVTTAQMTERRGVPEGADLHGPMSHIVAAAKEIDSLVGATVMYGSPGVTRFGTLSSVIAGVSLKLKPKVEASGSTVEWPHVPDGWRVDTSLGWVLTELITNSVKFCRDRPSMVKVTLSVSDGKALIGVQDEGPGIDPKHAETIMLPYRRLQGRGVVEGHGLGLAIAGRLAKQAGGSVRLAESPGPGALFLVEWPVME